MRALLCVTPPHAQNNGAEAAVAAKHSKLARREGGRRPQSNLGEERGKIEIYPMYVLNKREADFSILAPCQLDRPALLTVTQCQCEESEKVQFTHSVDQ